MLVVSYRIVSCPVVKPARPSAVVLTAPLRLALYSLIGKSQVIEELMLSDTITSVTVPVLSIEILVPEYYQGSWQGKSLPHCIYRCLPLVRSIINPGILLSHFPNGMTATLANILLRDQDSHLSQSSPFAFLLTLLSRAHGYDPSNLENDAISQLRDRGHARLFPVALALR